MSLNSMNAVSFNVSYVRAYFYYCLDVPINYRHTACSQTQTFYVNIFCSTSQERSLHLTQESEPNAVRFVMISSTSELICIYLHLIYCLLLLPLVFSKSYLLRSF